MKRLLIAAIVALAGCTTTEQANVAVGKRFIGKPADSFFAAYGPPFNSYKMQDGSTLYSWTENAQHFGTPGFATTTMIGNTAHTRYNAPGDIVVQCQLKLVVAPSGVVTSISVLSDTIGVWQMSRCNEIFNRKAKARG